jgi:homoserine kinase
MLPRLLPLAGRDGILGAALSGAGPAVLVIADGEASVPAAANLIRAALHDTPAPELIVCGFEAEGASRSARQTSR